MRGENSNNSFNKSQITNNKFQIKFKRQISNIK